MKQNARAAVKASFAADALALGAHLGPGAIPEAWLSGLAARDRTLSLPDRCDGA